MKKEENIEKGKKSINNQPTKDNEKRSFMLPQTDSKPPMPPVKPPKMN